LNFFEDLKSIAEAIRPHLPAQTCDTVLSQALQAVALRRAPNETDSWLTGPALLQANSLWPASRGFALQHTARIGLSELPHVVAGQPESGYLSFFDAYPWGDHVDWDFKDGLAQVTLDDGRDLVRTECPITPDHTSNFFFDSPAVFIEPAGTFWTVPSPYEMPEISDIDISRRGDASRSLGEHRVAGHFVGQLFGNAGPIQGDGTPQPRVGQTGLPPSEDPWINIAVFALESFDHCYSSTLQSIKDRTFEPLYFSAQCD